MTTRQEWGGAPGTRIGAARELKSDMPARIVSALVTIAAVVGILALSHGCWPI